MNQDHKDYREMKKSLDINNSDIAEITGHTQESINSMTQPNKEFPRWLKLVLYVWKRPHASIDWSRRK